MAGQPSFSNLGALTSKDADLDKVALIDLGTGHERRFSYRDFEAQANAVARALTARGLTETSPDPEDGRRLLVSLTRAGQQLAEKAAPNALAITRETLAPLDAREREMLMGLLSKLR